LKVTLIVQLSPAGSNLPQVFHSTKFLALVPEIVTLVMLTATVVKLVRVTTRAGLGALMSWPPKARRVGERLTASAFAANKLTVQGAEKSANPAMATIRAAAFTRARGRTLACV